MLLNLMLEKSEVSFEFHQVSSELFILLQGQCSLLFVFPASLHSQVRLQKLQQADDFKGHLNCLATCWEKAKKQRDLLTEKSESEV